MNNYNVVAAYIARKYIDRISGNDLADRIVGDEEIDLVMTGLLAEDRVVQSFGGKYVENQETKFQSIPSIGLKFDVRDNRGTIKIYPKGLLFYTVKPCYEEIVEYFISMKNKKDYKEFSTIDELIREYPNEKFILPKVYKHLSLAEVFSEGIEVKLDEISKDGLHLQDIISRELIKTIHAVIPEIKIIHETSLSFFFWLTIVFTSLA